MTFVSDALSCGNTYNHHRGVIYAPRVINYAPRHINKALGVINYAP